MCLFTQSVFLLDGLQLLATSFRHISLAPLWWYDLSTIPFCGSKKLFSLFKRAQQKLKIFDCDLFFEIINEQTNKRTKQWHFLSNTVCKQLSILPVMNSIEMNIINNIDREDDSFSMNCWEDCRRP